MQLRNVFYRNSLLCLNSLIWYTSRMFVCYLQVIWYCGMGGLLHVTAELGGLAWYCEIGWARMILRNWVGLHATGEFGELACFCGGRLVSLSMLLRNWAVFCILLRMGWACMLLRNWVGFHVTAELGWLACYCGGRRMGLGCVLSLYCFQTFKPQGLVLEIYGIWKCHVDFVHNLQALTLTFPPV